MGPRTTEKFEMSIVEYEEKWAEFETKYIEDKLKENESRDAVCEHIRSLNDHHLIFIKALYGYNLELIYHLFQSERYSKFYRKVVEYLRKNDLYHYNSHACVMGRALSAMLVSGDYTQQEVANVLRWCYEFRLPVREWCGKLDALPYSNLDEFLGMLSNNCQNMREAMPGLKPKSVVDSIFRLIKVISLDQVINLCPHPITLVDQSGDKELLGVPPFLGMGKGLRAREGPLERNGNLDGIPLVNPLVYDGIDGEIPPEVNGKAVIVSMLTAPAWKKLKEAGASAVFAPYTGTDSTLGPLRNEKGQLTKTRALVRWDE